MGVDRAYVSGLELGQRNPTVLLTLWHIAKALGVRLRLFFDEEKRRRPGSGWSLVIASVLVGVTAAVAQQIVPFAAELAEPGRRVPLSGR
jgi:transcriptional regulator with XRE-family HTH domain